MAGPTNIKYAYKQKNKLKFQSDIQKRAIFSFRLSLNNIIKELHLSFSFELVDKSTPPFGETSPVWKEPWERPLCT